MSFERSGGKTRRAPSRAGSRPGPKKSNRFSEPGERLDWSTGKSKPHKGKKSAGGKHRKFDENSRTKPFSERVKAKTKRGPWSESAYLPSQMLDAKGRRLPNVKPVAPKPPKGYKPPTKTAAPSTMEESQGMETAAPEAGNKERLQKVLARVGIASRRKAEQLILEGAVTINGRLVTELGTKVDAEKDKIKVNGKLIFTEVEPMYLALYKPKGVISSLNDPEGRNHLGQLLAGVRERVIPVGRLDYNSEGLMLLTNDGTLADRILKARELPKIYLVKVKGHPSEEDLEFLKRGIFTAEGVVRVSSYGVEQNLKSKSWIKLEVVEGAKLDLRELLNHRGLLVDRIVRTAIGPISIHGLQPGEYRLLKKTDFEKLLSFANT